MVGQPRLADIDRALAALDAKPDPFSYARRRRELVTEAGRLLGALASADGRQTLN